MNRMFAWLAKYKEGEGYAIVIEATPTRAKNRFHDLIQDGKLEDVRLTNQMRADGLTPDVITKDDDPRIQQIGFVASPGRKRDPGPPLTRSQLKEMMMFPALVAASLGKRRYY